VIDLRSDTLTRPTPAMRAAIAGAEVGDEQRGEDPTVNRLLERVAALTGKPDALFLPGGTMANTVAIAAHTRSAEAVLAHRTAHLVRSESAASVVFARVMIDAIDGPGGRFTADDVRRRAAAGSRYEPRSSLVCVEQTHNFAGGTVWPLEELAAVAGAAHELGMAVHMDGARLLNAVVATGVSAAAFCAPVDSVWICFTKGLGAPVGAVLAGERDFIARARRLKHVAGGALRQAGIAAAGCLHALDHHVARLADDHANARRLAAGLARLEAVELLTPEPQTNMVYFAVPAVDHDRFCAELADRGALVGPVGRQLRAVTHLDVDAAAIDDALERIAATARQGRPGP
jgi:threonine aldolase